MSVMPVMPYDHEWTVADLEAIPDDGLRYELFDGILVVSPAPRTRHQVCLLELTVLLRSACATGLQVLVSPIAWQPDVRTSLEPDIAVSKAADVDLDLPLTTLVLAVEVLSPSTRQKDGVLKRAVYERHGVQSYWMVDPGPGEPGIVVCELRDGRYLEVARAVGDEEISLTVPFPVTVRPSSLLTPPS